VDGERMKTLKWAACLILAWPLVARAQLPATRPTPAGQILSRPGGMLRGEWDEMMSFLAANSPNRARVLSQIDVWNNYPVIARGEVLRKWRNYKFVSEHFPEAAPLRIQKFRVEDDLFGLELQVRADPSQLQDVRPQVRTKEAELVQLADQEHQLRIQKLEKLLAQERQKLADEQSQQEKLIDQRTDKMMQRLGRVVAKAAAATRPSGGEPTN